MSKRICIIDDDPICVFTTKILIEASGQFDEVMIYNSGIDAFEALSQITEKHLFPEIILLDINMPIWDGWDFLNESISHPFVSNARIFVVSSSNDPEDIMKAKSYSMVEDFILKPIDISTFL